MSTYHQLNRRENRNVTEEPRFEYQVSPRVTLKKGRLFRLSGGPFYIGDDGVTHSLRLPGVFRFCSTVRRKNAGFPKDNRVWLNCVEVSRFGCGPNRTVLVAGDTCNQLGITWRPYKVRRTKMPWKSWTSKVR